MSDKSECQLDDTSSETHQVLTDLSQNLEWSLLKLQRLGPELSQSLHNDLQLPDRAIALVAAKAIDTLRQIQLLLDPPVLILADHFLGKTH